MMTSNNTIHKTCFFIIILLISYLHSISQAQESINQTSLNLQQAIGIATDSSLSSFKAKYIYLSGYWQYRTYQAERLPSLTLNLIPMQYNRNFVKRYDSQNDIDIYKAQQSVYSNANLVMSQNLDLTGGVFFIDTELDYLRNIGIGYQEQYSSVPFRIGYMQSLFGYNLFKWEKRIEPLHFEKIKKELIYNLEEISEQTTEFFFEQALNQVLFQIARQNVNNCDTLFAIGKERYQIGSISHADLLTIKLNVINAKIKVKDTEAKYKESAFNLSSYLQGDSQFCFNLEIPLQILNLNISVDKALLIAKENNPIIPRIKEDILKAKQNLDKTVKESRFSASVSASLGFNQIASELSNTYIKPLRQDLVSLDLKIPILDWGLRNGKINMAKKNLSAVTISSRQSEQVFEQAVRVAVYDYNVRQSQMSLLSEAKEISNEAYENAKQLFYIGKSDLNSVNVALNNKIEAEGNFVTALKKYWLSYFYIRKLTLYDFVNRKPIAIDFRQIN